MKQDLVSNALLCRNTFHVLDENADQNEIMDGFHFETPDILVVRVLIRADWFLSRLIYLNR